MKFDVELGEMQRESVCDPCENGEGLGCVMRIVSDPALEAVNQRIRDDWVRACALWTAEKEIREWRERLRETVAQLQAALRELDDALKVVRVGAGNRGQGKSSYSRAMGLCVESVEKELENGMVKDCGNGSCTLTNAMLKDFSGFSCSMMTGNVCVVWDCERSFLRSLCC